MTHQQLWQRMAAIQYFPQSLQQAAALAAATWDLFTLAKQAVVLAAVHITQPQEQPHLLVKVTTVALDLTLLEII
jgi:hypothetical protein